MENIKNKPASLGKPVFCRLDRAGDRGCVPGIIYARMSLSENRRRRRGETVPVRF